MVDTVGGVDEKRGEGVKEAMNLRWVRARTWVTHIVPELKSEIQQNGVFTERMVEDEFCEEEGGCIEIQLATIQLNIGGAQKDGRIERFGEEPTKIVFTLLLDLLAISAQQILCKPLHFNCVVSAVWNIDLAANMGQLGSGLTVAESDGALETDRADIRLVLLLDDGQRVQGQNAACCVMGLRMMLGCLPQISNPLTVGGVFFDNVLLCGLRFFPSLAVIVE